MATKKKLLEAAAGNAGGAALNVEDVFSTYLYDGTSATQTITNGTDLAGDGGMTWIKSRTSTTTAFIYDTERGATKSLTPSETGAQETDVNTLTDFNSNGFSVGSSSKVNYSLNRYASWTFRKAPKFFDCITWTGDANSTQTLSHALGCAVGAIFVKATSTANNWETGHLFGASSFTQAYLNLDSQGYSRTYPFGLQSEPTTTEIVVSDRWNIDGTSYVAYLFAHNDGDGNFGPNGDADIIKCGSFTGNGSADGPEIDLGFEPQWILTKGASQSGNWVISDNMRGTVTGGDDEYLLPNSSGAAGLQNNYEFNSTGFKVTTTNLLNTSGETYIYIAIRRGPMAVPESGTEVFDVETKGTLGAPAYDSGFPVDMLLVRNNKNTTFSTQAWDRLRSTFSLTDSTAVEEAFSSSYLDYFDHNDGFDVAGGPDSNDIAWMFRRAPSFFDVVAYSGNSTARTIPHSLGVAPEMIWVKARDNATYWPALHKDINITGSEWLILSGTGAPNVSSTIWNATLPTESVFSVGTSPWINGSSYNYIAYLFASLDGVSKVGSYTGNGSSQTINCGFTSGARFVLIKRIDDTGDWYVWDTQRGIVAANDPHLSLNTTVTEVTTDDSVDPVSSGFAVNQNTATNINVSSASYIFYAIA